MEKSKYFLDLSKCTEEEQKNVFSLLPYPTLSNDYNIYDNYIYLMYDENDEDWWVASNFPKWHLEKRAELTYPEFIKLFEGGEVETDVELIKIKTLDKFKLLKKGDLVVIKWKRDMYFGNKIGRFGTYEIVENKERTTEIILQTKHNVYFNYMMFLFPQEHGVSSCESIYLIKSNQ